MGLIAPYMIQNLKDLVTALLPRTRKSNPVSKLLRPIFEKKQFPTLLGVQLIATSMVASVMVYPTQALEPSVEENTVVTAELNQVLTEQTFRQPLEQTLGVSQGYNFFHRGVDIRAPIGTPVHSVAVGQVVEIQYLRYGWGHYVRVSHGENMETLYAHLGQINVKFGQAVDKETVLGTVGLTGKTTGAHLHLEMKLDGKYVNPLGAL